MQSILGYDHVAFLLQDGVEFVVVRRGQLVGLVFRLQVRGFSVTFCTRICFHFMFAVLAILCHAKMKDADDSWC